MNLEKINFYSVPLITVLFIIRSAIPYVIYPFIGFFIIYTIYFIIYENRNYKTILKYFSRFRLYFLLLLFYLIALLFTKTISFTLTKEILNTLALFIIGYYWFCILDKYDNWENLKRTFLWQFLFFSLFAAITGIIKYLFQINGVKFSFLEYGQWFQTTSLVNDHNFYSLNLLIGIGITIQLMAKKLTRLNRLLLQTSFFLLSLSILFSGSRRGFIIIIFGYFLLLIYYLINFFKKNSPSSKRIIRNTLPSLIFFYSIVGILVLFMFFTSSQFKNRFFDNLNIDFKTFRNGVNLTISDYATIFNPDISFAEIDRLIWDNSDLIDSLNINYPLFPELYNIVNSNYITFPLLYSSQIPAISGGVRFDPTSKIYVWEYPNSQKKLLFSKYTLPKISVDSHKVYTASTWCYVSDSSDVDMVRLEYPKSTFNGVFRSYYDLSQKGVWQKLTVNFLADRDTSLRFSFLAGKYNFSDSYKFQGFVLFAYPQVNEKSINFYTSNSKYFTKKNISKKTNVYDQNGKDSSFYKFSELHYLIEKEQRKNDILDKISKFFDNILNHFEIRRSDLFFQKGYYLKAAKGYRKVLISDPSNKLIKEKLKSCFSKNDFILQSINQWNEMNSLLIENITEQNKQDDSYKTKQLGKVIESKYHLGDSTNNDFEELNYEIYFEDYNKFYGQRTERWKYAFQIYFYEYSLIQKLFGNGFNYQKEFGIKFKKNDLVDYPHNIIISAFLYSGLVGGLFYLYFIIYVFRWFWKQKKKESLFGMLTILAFAYSMVSSNSHFDSTILAVFTLIPFLLNDKYK